MIKTLGKIDDPEKSVGRFLEAGNEVCIHFELDHLQYYSSNRTIQLGVICYINKNECRLTITSAPASMNTRVQKENSDAAESPEPLKANQLHTSIRRSYDLLVRTLDLPDIDLYRPLKLEPLVVKKNWGQEIWYTGIEERGVCSVQTLPLPWLLNIVGKHLTGQESNTPILLKILDPFPEAAYGDLYFELHTRKREVYIVTHVDTLAWPDGIGKIRYGFNKNLRDEYPDDKTFKRDYLNAVQDYQRIRRLIDAHLDDQKEARHLRDPVPIKDQDAWKDQLDSKILENEKALRDRMEAFTSEYDLHVGDVIEVHPGTPHSLQHGVRVIEFQTPHYERKILYYTQKVLTQDHWDTGEVLDDLKIDWQTPKILGNSGKKESCVIADFDEFSLTRYQIIPGERLTLDESCYYLMIGVEGQLSIDNSLLESEEALYITALTGSVSIFNHGKTRAILLAAWPK